MKIRTLLTRRILAGFGVSALAAAALAGIPSAASAAANITVDRSALIFGPVAVGSSQDLTLTVKNEGATTAFSANIGALPPFGTDFTLQATTCPLGFTDFAAGATCTITFRFTPSSPDPVVATAGVFVNYYDGGPFTPPQVSKNLTVTLLGNVTCGGAMPTISGTEGNDTINGTSGNDVIVALDGEDVIVADGGNDVVCGGGDGDFIKGGTGKDKLFGDGGSDVLNGGKGKDLCVGGLSVDRARKCEKVSGL